MSLAFLQILVYQPLKVARVHPSGQFCSETDSPGEKPAPLRPLSPVPFLPVITRIHNTAPWPLDCCLLGPLNQALLLQTMASNMEVASTHKKMGKGKNRKEKEQEKRGRNDLLWVAVSAASENFQTMAVA